MLTYPIGLLAPKKGGIPRNGLIGEWLFDGNADDTSGYGNNGIVTGAILSTDRKSNPNSCYGFYSKGTSTTDNINLGNSSPLIDIPNSDFSFSVWVWDYWQNVTNLGTVWHPYDGTSKGCSIRTIGIVGDNNRAIRFHVFYNTTTMTYESVRAIPSRTWTHIVVTFNNTAKTGKIYMNASEMSYNTQTPGSGTLVSDASINKTIGKLGTSTLQTWNGYLDDLRIYNRILTSDEITVLYNE